MSRPDRPSPVVILSSAFGVLVILAFVGALFVADTATTSSPDAVRVVRGPVLQVLRCQDERVAAVSVDGRELTVDSLARRFELPPDARAVRVLVGGRTLAADVGANLPADDGGPRGTPPPCPRRGHVSVSTVLFGVAALGVVGGFAATVVRFVRT